MAANLVPEGATFWVLVGADTSDHDPMPPRFRYFLRAEHDEGLEMFLVSLPEPGPHLVGDRFATHNGDIYVLA